MQLKIKRLENELMYLKEDNNKLVARVEQLQVDLKIAKSDLSGKNWMLDKALIDTALLVQEVSYLKEQITLLKRIK